MDASGVFMGADAGLKWGLHAGADTPRKMESWHGIAMPIGETAAAFGPPHNREPAYPHRVQPAAHVTRGKVDIAFRPLARPVILGAIKLGTAHPVVQGQLCAILNAHAALFGGVDDHQAAQRP